MKDLVDEKGNKLKSNYGDNIYIRANITSSTFMLP